jgi:hypothetical protein
LAFKNPRYLKETGFNCYCIIERHEGRSDQRYKIYIKKWASMSSDRYPDPEFWISIVVSLSHRVPAVDMDLLPADPPDLVGRKEYDHVGDILRLPNSTEG